VLFSANTGLRPDEARRLQFRDVTIVEDDASGQTILEIEVRGKRGVGYGRAGAALSAPSSGRSQRRREGTANHEQRSAELRLPQPTDLLFPKWQRELFGAILDEENLKVDREGRPRTAYSLRHTHICLRLMEGADIYQIAKNCRTSVEMIEKYYAAHIKTNLDAAAINIMRPKPKKKQNLPMTRKQPQLPIRETDV
jgi:integrase